MEQEDEQAVEFYDFLYRDSNRLTSYYSQIFEGKLTSIEELENNRESRQKNRWFEFASSFCSTSKD